MNQQAIDKLRTECHRLGITRWRLFNVGKVSKDTAAKFLAGGEVTEKTFNRILYVVAVYQETEKANGESE
ncbi:hypothetical protein ABFV67_11390 [Vibrio metschnikovii]|uniref:XRE family transcriptional regulator n=1 Tax=bacterium 19PA01SH03 TaxID=2920705 RepID=A0AAU6SP69_UNCXX|nr:hypothetical protein [Vibrio metschnikovii]EKO3683604.1 hypothetical protein [Vibrio metschnikovii]EKO3739408.1 hypothetical protein [Vibrio metschnikovii]EKO3873011.1 hypothetical protein [Vibrio metschnikovii]EKO3882737.1 hypothetical protein [Vibrio metschnikovii]